MATKIRLKRIGRRNRPFYRMVVMDSRKRRDGAAIEELGWYNPINVGRSCELNSERIIYWLGKGAQPTDTAHKLFKKMGIAYKWHLIKSGLDESSIDKEMKKWELDKEAIQKEKLNKLTKKSVKDKSKNIEDESNVEAKNKLKVDKNLEDNSKVLENSNDVEKISDEEE